MINSASATVTAPKASLDTAFVPTRGEFELILADHPYLMDNYFNIEDDADREELYNRYYDEVWNFFYKDDESQLTLRDKMCFYNLLGHLIWYFTVGIRDTKPVALSGNVTNSTVGDVSLSYGISGNKNQSNFFNLTPMGQFYLLCLRRKKTAGARGARLIKGATVI